MVNGTVFLFPGQGSQYPGMGLDFYQSGIEAVKTVFSAASEIMGRDMVSLLRDSGADTLKQSDIAQPAISLANLAAWFFLREKGIAPSAAAGHSLGEYSALTAAGVISVEDCFRLVKARGKAMRDATETLLSGDADDLPGMAAVTGLPPEKVESLVLRCNQEGLRDIYCANFNSPGQTVISGSAAALREAEKRFREAGARRVVRLPVSGPFHSPFMRSAAGLFAGELETVHFGEPVIPVFSNVTGAQILSGDEAKRLALRQITESVRWTAIMGAIQDMNCAAAIETGPGKTLQGLWKDSGTPVPCHGAGTVAEAEKTAAKILPGGEH